MPPLRIAVAARKGGVGKTTIATGLAALFADRDMPTALIDLDPQSNAAFALGVDPAGPGTANLLLGQKVEPQVVHPGLVVYPGGPELMNHRLNALDPVDLHDAVARMSQRVVIFDCPPGNEHLERQAIVAANYALLVLDAHPFAVVGAHRVLESIRTRQERQRSHPNHLAVVACRLDLRRAADRGLESELTQIFTGVPVLRVRQDAQLASAAADHVLLSALPGDSRGRQDLELVAQWILDQSQTDDVANIPAAMPRPT